MALVLFILVALAALALTMRDLAVSQHLETAQSLAVRQAQFAARSSLDWSRDAIASDVWSCLPSGACNGHPASLTVGDIVVGLDCACARFQELDVERITFEVGASAVANPGTLTEAQRRIRGVFVR